MKALVTGGGGFIGGGIVRALVERGDEVRSFARGDYPSLRGIGVETQRGDVADPEAVAHAVEGRDTVFHTAGITSSWGAYKTFHETNVCGTENVIAACRTLAIPKLVFTSSPSITFRGRDQEGIGESIGYPDTFLGHYSKTKALAEALVLKANGDALATVALRPHLIWGPGDTQLTPRIVEQGRSGRLKIIGSGEQLIDATYIDNAVYAHILAADCLEKGAPCAGKAYYITNDEPIPIADMINGILEAAGIAPIQKHISPALAYLAGSIFEILWKVLTRKDEPPMTRFVARQLATAHWFDIAAAKRDLGYAPIVSMQEGLTRLRDHFDTPQ